MPFPYLGETKDLNESTHAGADGSFVTLKDGVTHYEIGGISPLPQGAPFGDDKGPGVALSLSKRVRDIVLVHGFSTPYFIYDPLFEFLRSLNYRVLRYDLFGRGLSDRPRVQYDIHLFVQQLTDLLDALQFGPVDLVGLSMGGPITAAFLAQYPEQVRTHILIDPAGANALPFAFMLKALKLPGIWELVFGLFGSESLLKSVASDFFAPAHVEMFQARYRVQMQYKGFKRAILSTMRSGMLNPFKETYERAASFQKPTLLFWGCNDKTVPFEQSKDLLAAIPHAEFHAIEECGHLPHVEKPKVFNPILKRFLETNAGN
ncbi:MAG: alpha/beta hydrolase [Chloroflexota bacterium]